MSALSGTSRTWILAFAALVSAAVFLPQALQAEEPYTFDVSETERKPYHFGGYIEAKPVNFWTDHEAALYKLKFYNRDEGKTLQEYNLKLQLEGSYEKGIGRFYFKTNTDYKNSYLGNDEDSTFYEAYLTLKPSPGTKVDAGKRTFKWGKGYAWNPAAFIDRLVHHGHVLAFTGESYRLRNALSQLNALREPDGAGPQQKAPTPTI